jgi:hypothetical protein
MRILNLTQHPASPEQVSAGVVEPQDKKAVQNLLTFNTLPTREDVFDRAVTLANMAVGYDAAMIGGVGYLVTRLENALEVLGVKALHAFSVRESVEEVQPDGSTKKVMVFRHAGFVNTCRP